MWPLHWNLKQCSSGMDHAVCLLSYACVCVRTHSRAEHSMTIDVLSLNGGKMVQKSILVMAHKRQWKHKDIRLTRLEQNQAKDANPALWVVALSIIIIIKLVVMKSATTHRAGLAFFSGGISEWGRWLGCWLPLAATHGCSLQGCKA